MAAPPSPATSLNLSALSKLKLTTTPQGMRAFFIKFPAALGPLLAATLRKTLNRSTLNPFDSREASLFSLINDALVGCVQDDDDVIAMSTACGTNGPMALVWLQRTYDPTSTASALVTLIDMFTTSLGDDTRKGLDMKIAQNHSLHKDLQLPEPVLVVRMLCMLPPDLNNLRDLIVERDAIPTPTELCEKVQNQGAVAGASSMTGKSRHGALASAFSFAAETRNKFCFNCDTTGHHRSTCTKPIATCSVCGVLAGHPDKHCLVQSDKPIPAGISSERRAKIESARKAYKTKTGAAVLFVPNEATPLEENDESFWDMLARHT